MTPIVQIVAPRLLPVAVMVAAALIVKGYADVGEAFGAGVIVALAIGLRYVVLGPERADRTMPIVRKSTSPTAKGRPPTTKRAAEVLSATTLFRSNLKSR